MEHEIDNILEQSSWGPHEKQNAIWENREQINISLKINLPWKENFLSDFLSQRIECHVARIFWTLWLANCFDSGPPPPPWALVPALTSGTEGHNVFALPRQQSSSLLMVMEIPIPIARHREKKWDRMILGTTGNNRISLWVQQYLVDVWWIRGGTRPGKQKWDFFLHSARKSQSLVGLRTPKANPGLGQRGYASASEFLFAFPKTGCVPSTLSAATRIEFSSAMQCADAKRTRHALGVTRPKVWQDHTHRPMNPHLCLTNVRFSSSEQLNYPGIVNGLSQKAAKNRCDNWTDSSLPLWQVR